MNKVLQVQRNNYFGIVTSWLAAGKKGDFLSQMQQKILVNMQKAALLPFAGRRLHANTGLSLNLYTTVLATRTNRIMRVFPSSLMAIKNVRHSLDSAHHPENWTKQMFFWDIAKAIKSRTITLIFIQWEKSVTHRRTIGSIPKSDWPRRKPIGKKSPKFPGKVRTKTQQFEQFQTKKTNLPGQNHAAVLIFQQWRKN